MPSPRVTKTVLSAFSGAGGLDLGLEAAGFETVACIEKDALARETLSINRPGWKLIAANDIGDASKSLTPAQLGMKSGELGILCGGPPCQPFSKAAQWNSSSRMGLADPRATPLGAFFALAEKFVPHSILIENVPGFVSGPVSAIGEIKKLVDGLNKETRENYRITHQVINCADFGVPQRRKRAIIVITRDQSEFQWPEPTHVYNPVRAWDALAGIEISNPPPALGKWASLLPSIPEGQNYLWHTSDGGGVPLFGYRTRFWNFLLKLARDQPAWTIAAQPGPGSGPFHWDNRPLAPEEAARLQTFPKTWRFAGCHRDQIRQVGNATPPLLAETIGRAIASQYFSTTFDRQLKYKISRKRNVPEPGSPSRVPPQFKKLEGQHKAHPGSGRGPAPRQLSLSS